MPKRLQISMNIIYTPIDDIDEDGKSLIRKKSEVTAEASRILAEIIDRVIPSSGYGCTLVSGNKFSQWESNASKMVKLEAFAWQVIHSLQIHGPHDQNSHATLNQLWKYLRELDEERGKQKG